MSGNYAPNCMENSSIWGMCVFPTSKNMFAVAGDGNKVFY